MNSRDKSPVNFFHTDRKQPSAKRQKCGRGRSCRGVRDALLIKSSVAAFETAGKVLTLGRWELSIRRLGADRIVAIKLLLAALFMPKNNVQWAFRQHVEDILVSAVKRFIAGCVPFRAIKNSYYSWTQKSILS